MPASETLECFLSTSAGRISEYLPPPDDPVLAGPSNANTYIRYVSITGLQNLQMCITLEGTENFRWSEERCMKISADFYIDGVFLGQRPFHEHFENGRAPRIVFGTIKKYDVNMNGDRIVCKAALTFKEVEFAAQRNLDMAPISIDSLGEITIKVFRYKGGYLVQEYDNAQRHRRPKSAPSLAFEQTLTEQDVKGRGIEYLIGTNEYRNVAPFRQNRHQFGRLRTRRYDMEIVDPPQSPYLCFRYLYRTRAHLEALGLINANSILRNPSLGGDVGKRERDSISPLLGNKRIKAESENNANNDEDDDFVILNDKPAIFRNPYNTPWRPQTSMFKVKIDKGKRPIRNTDQEGSSSELHSGITPAVYRTAPTTGNAYRTVYVEDADGYFVGATETMSLSQMVTLIEDNEGNFQLQPSNLPQDAQGAMMTSSDNKQSVTRKEVQTICLDQGTSIPESQLNTLGLTLLNSQEQLQNEEQRQQQHSGSYNEDFIPFEEDDDDDTSDIDIVIY